MFLLQASMYHMLLLFRQLAVLIVYHAGQHGHFKTPVTYIIYTKEVAQQVIDRHALILKLRCQRLRRLLLETYLLRARL